MAVVAVAQFAAAVFAVIAAFRAAGAARTSADAIRALNRQWVSFENWRISIGRDVETGKYSVMARVDVYNRTTLPMHLRVVVEMTGKENWKDLHYLAPGSAVEWRMNWHMSDKDAADYFAGNAFKQLAGWAHFIDAFNAKQRHPFAVNLSFGQGEMTVTSPPMFLPTDRLKDDPDSGYRQTNA
jgi:hypothetical protein